MEFVETAFSDLVTGAGVPAIYALSSAGDDSPWVALGGWAGGMALTALHKYRSPPSHLAQLARSLLVLSLSAAQLFYVFDAKDGDVGAGLAAVPLFFVTCMQPCGFLSDYAKDARLLCSLLTAAALLAACVHFQFVDGKALPLPASEYDAGLLRALSVVAVAFAAESAEGELLPAAARGGALAALSVLRPALKGLLRGPHPLSVLSAYGAALAWSCHHAACRARLASSALLSPRDPQRALMLMAAPALTIGFVERRGDPGHLMFAVLCAVVWGLLEAALPVRRTGRSD